MNLINNKQKLEYLTNGCEQHVVEKEGDEDDEEDKVARRPQRLQAILHLLVREAHPEALLKRRKTCEKSMRFS